MPLHLEDLAPGRVFHPRPITVTRDDALAFGRQFDPQPFHTDAEGADSGFFGTLVASGWHTAALCMRAAVESELGTLANGIVGLEVRNMRWPVPTLPGDTLTMTAEVLETRPSRSKPGFGTAHLRWRAVNQRGETALELTYVGWIARRPGAQ